MRRHRPAAGRSRALAAAAALAVLAACASAPAPPGDERPEATPRSAGRVVGARIGVLEYGAGCAAAVPALAPQFATALGHWRLRNDAVVDEVRSRFLASLGSGTDEQWLDAELRRIARGVRAGLAELPAGARDAFCRHFLAQLEQGREDVGFKYRADVAAWLGRP